MPHRPCGMSGAQDTFWEPTVISQCRHCFITVLTSVWDCHGRGDPVPGDNNNDQFLGNPAKLNYGRNLAMWISLTMAMRSSTSS